MCTLHQPSVFLTHVCSQDCYTFRTITDKRNTKLSTKVTNYYYYFQIRLIQSSIFFILFIFQQIP